MGTVLHNLCNSASRKLHYSLNDCFDAHSYIFTMTTKQEAGRRIKAARLAKGMTLKEVCAKIPGWEFNRLSNWEQGRNMIGVDEAKLLAPVLGISTAYILTLSDTPDDTPADPAIKKLTEMYLISDDRGKAAIFRAAELESSYAIAPSPPDQPKEMIRRTVRAQERRRNQTPYAHPDRRKGEKNG